MTTSVCRVVVIWSLAIVSPRISEKTQRSNILERKCVRVTFRMPVVKITADICSVVDTHNSFDFFTDCDGGERKMEGERLA